MWGLVLLLVIPFLGRPSPEEPEPDRDRNRDLRDVYRDSLRPTSGELATRTRDRLFD